MLGKATIDDLLDQRAVLVQELHELKQFHVAYYFLKKSNGTYLEIEEKSLSVAQKKKKEVFNWELSRQISKRENELFTLDQYLISQKVQLPVPDHHLNIDKIVINGKTYE